jgi:acyl-CoA hydrolase
MSTELKTHQLSMTVLMSPEMANFSGKVHGGAILRLLDQASVNYTGTSSMEIGIKVVAEDILKRSVRHANSCFFTMVAVDEEGRPTPVPSLQPVTSDEKRRQAAALIRRQLRQEMEQRHLELLASNPPSPEE